jgi:hypothetical protein
MKEEEHQSSEMLDLDPVGISGHLLQFLDRDPRLLERL